MVAADTHPGPQSLKRDPARNTCRFSPNRAAPLPWARSPVRINIDAITTFRSNTGKPDHPGEDDNRLQVVDVAVSGDVDPSMLKQITERVRAELTATPGSRKSTS